MAEETPVSWTRSIDKETESPVEGILSGKIPEWLQGTLIRNGSGMYEFGGSQMNHLFDGMSVLHRFAVKDGKATYHNRLLKSRSYLEGIEAKRLTLSQFGTCAFPDPCKSLLGRFMSRFEPVSRGKMTDNDAVNVCYIGDKLYALTETTLMRQVDPASLETIGDQVNVTDFVAVNHSTAHPHVDEDGTVFNMGTSYGSKGTAYNVVEFPPGEASFSGAKIAASFPARWKMNSSYYHSFGITENYFVFIESPLILNSLKLMTLNMRQAPFNSAFEWSPKERARILLAERKTGKVLEQIYETPGFFTFHHGNAYEKDGYLIMDVSAYANANVITELSLKNLKEKGSVSNPYYCRYLLPLNAQAPEKRTSFLYPTHEEPTNLIQLEGFKGKSYWMNQTTIMCEPERLASLAIELPRINYRHNGKHYRFVYGISQNEGSAEAVKILKLDVETKEVKEWSKEGFSVSEPVYVARPGSTEEDDGCILFSALDLADPKKVLLVVLNASTFQQEASVEFEASGTVTKDFHGIFSRDGETVHLY